MAKLPIYRNKKTQGYYVLLDDNVAHSETQERMVSYCSLPYMQRWVRPAKLFEEKFEKVTSVEPAMTFFRDTLGDTVRLVETEFMLDQFVQQLEKVGIVAKVNEGQ